jgi:SET domain
MKNMKVSPSVAVVLRVGYSLLLFLSAHAEKSLAAEIPHDASSCPTGDSHCLLNAATADSGVRQDNEAPLAAGNGSVPQADHGSCYLYLAPSTIANAGFGVFAGSDIPAGSIVGEQELFVIIADKFKTLPYRGQHRFLSWLGYVYPEEPDAFWHSSMEAFPSIHPSHYKIDEGLSLVEGMPFVNAFGDPVNAFVPGIAAMANSHQEHANIDRDPTSHKNEVVHSSSHPLPYTPHHGVHFIATKDIPAGSELFLDYGDDWHDQYDFKHKNGFVEFESTPAEYMEDRDIIIPTENDKRGKRPDMEELLKETLMNKFHEDLMAEAKQRSTGGGGSVKKLYKQNETHEEETTVATTVAVTKISDSTENSTTYVETKVSVTTTTTNIHSLPGVNNTMGVIGTSRLFPIGTHVLDEDDEGGWVEGSLTGYKEDTDDDTNEYEVTFSNGDVQFYSADEEVIEIVDNAVAVANARLRKDWLERLVNRMKYQEQTGNQKAGSRPLQWLQEKGICVSSLRADKSIIPGAGRGAFANHAIARGGLIATAPLLVLKRDDLVIYDADETKKILREVLNFDKVVGYELLLNYAYGTEGSSLLLVPFAPVVNFINHNSQAPNAIIRWPEKQSLFRDAQEWLDLHPLDVLDQSGKLSMEFIAVRDIAPGEEITLDYGRPWEEAWEAYIQSDKQKEFRHEIHVPPSFYPQKWDQNAIYELANIDAPLGPGEIDELKWAHNGKRVADGLMRVGLPKGFSAKMREYADERQITGLYERLTSDSYLTNDGWHVISPKEQEEWFAHRYMNTIWKFNMHYVAAWNEPARRSVLNTMMEEGFDIVLGALGKHFGLNTTTCFHFSFMGLSEADSSFTHADVYASGNKAYNLIYPIITVEGSKPELDIIGDNANIEIPVKYKDDVAYVLGDWGYHKTAANDNKGGQLRLVAGTYCGQIDETNHELLAHIYDGENPAPFMSQFELPIKEYHWKASS